MHSNERTIVGRYEKKLCQVQVCTWSCAHLASCWRPLCPLLRWWLCWHCWCCPLCCRSRCHSCWCLLCVCCTGIHCAGACRAGVCRAGVLFVMQGCCCHAGVFVVLVLVTHGAGILVWHLPCWYLSWVWVCRAGVALILLVFVVGSTGLFALKKRNISVK